MNNTIHHGRNVKRLREILGLKQEAIASELGEGWNQKRVSLMEDREFVEPEILDSLAKIFKLPVKVISEFNENSILNTLTNPYDTSISQERDIKQLFLIKQVIKLYEDRTFIYDRMLKDNEEHTSWVMQFIL